jgi:GcrA cell cycle regulator
MPATPGNSDVTSTRISLRSERHSQSQTHYRNQARARRGLFHFWSLIMSWTSERVDILKQLWANGQSASAIAAKLGEVTRNAVIGKVHRLGLAGRVTKGRRPRSQRRSLAARRPHTIRARTHANPLQGKSRTRRPAILPALAPAPERLVTVENLTRSTCRWPEGDPREADFHFCGRPKMKTQGAYCGHHAAIAYR